MRCGGEVARLDTTPWKNFHGDLPDYDHPLRCVYESGIQYAVNLLAATLKVDDWEICDGTEEFDGDLGGTLFSIFLAALPTDQHGDPMYPSEIAATIAQLRDRVAALEEGLRVARGQFAFYVEQHLLKSPPDEAKAKTNQSHVERIDALLKQNEVG